MTDPERQFRWGKLVAECAQELLRSQSWSATIVDVEVIPPFDGSPDGIFVWFICARRADVPVHRAKSLPQATSRLRELLTAAGFPASGYSSLQSDFTSVEDIDAAGGRFNYFR